MSELELTPRLGDWSRGSDDLSIATSALSRAAVSRKSLLMIGPPFAVQKSISY
jgi:hypothetical protein